jgi:phosphomannomutase
VKSGYRLASVGGSNIDKVRFQLGDAIDLFDFIFAENGTAAYKSGEMFHSNSIQKWMGDADLTEFNNFVLRLIADQDIPLKTGTFIELRHGMINISPIGRNCSQAERDAFVRWDTEHRVREEMVRKLSARYGDRGLAFAIGGQISIDVFPKGWDKTYCLQFLDEAQYPWIYFFGDRTAPGGNDHEISKSSRLAGVFPVQNPGDTEYILRSTFLWMTDNVSSK